MSRKPAFFWWVLVFGTGLLICFAGAGVEYWRHTREAKDLGWWEESRNGSWYVGSIVRGSSADGVLAVGDRIITHEGQQPGPGWLVTRVILMVPIGGSVHFTIERNGRRMEVAVPVRRVRIPMDWGIPILATGSLVCFIFAVVIGLLKPADRTIQFGCFTYLALAALQLAKSLDSMYWVMDGWGRVMMGLLALSDPLPAATGYLFAARFPRKVPGGRWWKAIGMFICIATFAEWLALTPYRVMWMMDGTHLVSNARWLVAVLPFYTLVPEFFYKLLRLLAFVAIGAVLIRNYRALPNPDLRRRIRWLVGGMVAALAPGAAVYLAVASFLVTGFGVAPGTPGFERAEQVATAFLAIVSSGALAYGVLQHRLLDIHVVVRRSIQYLLAKRVLQAALLLPVLALVIRVVVNPQVTVRGLVFDSYHSLGVAAAAGLGLAYRRSLLVLVDRRFFREEYNQERILRTLIEEIKDSDSISDVSRLVSEEVEAALHPQRVLVFYRRESHGDFTLGHSSGGTEPELRISGGSAVLRILEDSAGPCDLPFSDSGVDLSSAEREYLERLEVCLLVPMTGSERRLVGILMLGDKRSESPYTQTDRELLQAIAAQIAVVYENISLRESARREAQIKRNVLAHLDGGDINLLKECPRCGACHDRAAERCAVDGAELTLTLPVDRTIDGVYRLDRRIGSGAMGAVYAATDLRLSRKVAVKLMVGSLFGNRAALRRFEREARAAARLSHPNIVAIHDFGALASEGAYLVMELIEGRTLRAELRACARLAPDVASATFDQLLEGLSAAHMAGVVHRDLKPENLILARLTGGGELVKILDFGLAKITEVAEYNSLTLPGAVVGTLGYMSPEQLLGQEVDDRTDTFAVGVMSFECLTGRRPFAGATLQELLQSTLHQRAQIPGEGVEVERLNAVLARCLAKERAERPHAAEVREELVDAMRQCPAVASSAPAGKEVSTVDATRSF